MAVTAFGTNDAQAIKLWSTVTMREALKATLMNRLMGSGKRAIVQRLTELEKGAGDTIKYDLLMQMTGAGVEGEAGGVRGGAQGGLARWVRSSRTAASSYAAAGRCKTPAPASS